MSTALTVLNLAIVVVLLARDWGHRRVTVFGLLRPLILAAVVVPIVTPGWDLTGHGLLLVVGAAVVGAALGILTCTFMRVSVDPTGHAWTDAGLPYVVAWVIIAGARQLFIYGVQHWFTRDIGRFLVDNHISVNSFADAILLLTLGTMIANRLTILVRTRLAAGAPATVEPAAPLA